MKPPDLQESLRHLLAEWEHLAADARRRSRDRTSGDVHTPYFYYGVAKTYERVISDISHLIDLVGEEAAAEPHALNFIRMSAGEASAVIKKAGLFARDVIAHDDGAFTAIFSRIQPVALDVRVKQLQAADERVMILASGKLGDTGDPYIDFAFVQP